MTTDRTAIRQTAEERTALTARFRALLVEALDLPVSADQIDDDQPLFGRGLELDSLDTLEIVSVVEEEFGVAITDDDRYVFGSVNKVVDFIVAHRQEQPA